MLKEKKRKVLCSVVIRQLYVKVVQIVNKIRSFDDYIYYYELLLL